MANNTFIQLPSDVTNSAELRLFLSRLVEELDILAGNRGLATLVSAASLNASRKALPSLNLASTTPSIGYSQVEAANVANQVQAVQSKLNDIIDMLQVAKIVV